MKTIDIQIITYNGVNILDITGPAQVFSQANHAQSNSSIRYQVSLVSNTGGLVQSCSGIGVNTIKFDQVLTNVNTVLIAGGSGVHQAMKDHTMIEQTKKLCDQSNRVGSVCTGAFLLAMTGLLDGKRAVTHWRYIQEFQARFPTVQVKQDPIYVCDQGVWTSAGVCAGIDLALAMVQKDLGHQCALETAREMVIYLKRTGGQSQFSTPLYNQSKDASGLFDQLHHWILDNLHTDLSIDKLADKMNMSQRTFFRLYKATFNITPAKNIKKMRIEVAKEKLENSTQRLNLIALSCGFNNEARFRHAFMDQVGISPTAYRSQFKAS